MTFYISINPEILMLKPRRFIAQFCTIRLRFSYFLSAKCRFLQFTADFEVKYQYILFGVNPIEPFLPTI